MEKTKEEILKEYETARLRMVEEKIAMRGIKDRRVLRSMEKVPRHFFVDEALIPQAYNDHPLPIGENQTISQPYIVALMLEALEMKGNEKVLEVGTGSGYQTALLAELAGMVLSIERIASLVEKATWRLEFLGYKNIKIKLNDGTRGWEEEKPFDRIIVSAASPSIPEPYIEQLNDNGIIVIPVGVEDTQTLLKVKKSGGTIRMEDLGGCRFVKLVGKYAWNVDERSGR
jgi:protein-L-isoaspartate(D-aspartate) O-methyltransferase